MTFSSHVAGNGEALISSPNFQHVLPLFTASWSILNRWECWGKYLHVNTQLWMVDCHSNSKFCIVKPKNAKRFCEPTDVKMTLVQMFVVGILYCDQSKKQNAWGFYSRLTLFPKVWPVTHWLIFLQITRRTTILGKAENTCPGGKNYQLNPASLVPTTIKHSFADNVRLFLFSGTIMAARWRSG